MAHPPEALESWGRYPQAKHDVIHADWVSGEFERAISEQSGTVLPYGQGRSYGDCCLNDGNCLIATRFLNRIISFDPEYGVIKCEAGLTLKELHDFTVPRGYFIPVSPGTENVSIGGAIANDVHGKNHHGAGTFGNHIVRFLLLRSNGERLECSRHQNSEFFAATIAGLGLTGLILWAELKLKKIPGELISAENLKFRSLQEFFEVSAASDKSYEYTVAWLDCVARGRSFGRGIFMRGNFSSEPAKSRAKRGSARLGVPFDLPNWALNHLSVKLFNSTYYRMQALLSGKRTVHYRPFFYPLDSVSNWNKIYGKRGLIQFQCVVPKTDDNRPISEILGVVVETGRASFLAVLKEFGTIASPGLLSFPRPGITLCLDFPMEGEVTVNLMKRLDEMTREFGGAIYPAKDAFMSAHSFEQYFPALPEFERLIDPKFSSSFWRRVRG